MDGIDAQVTYGYEIYKTKDNSLTLPFPNKKTNERYQGRAFNNGKMIINIRELCKQYPKYVFDSIYFNSLY